MHKDEDGIPTFPEDATYYLAEETIDEVYNGRLNMEEGMVSFFL